MISVTIFILGDKFLKVQFNTSKIRENVLFLTMFSLTFAVCLSHIVIMLTRNQQLIYRLIYCDCHYTTSISSFIIFLSIQTFFMLDMVATFNLKISVVYVYLFSSRFWIQKIWYVLNYINYITTFFEGQNFIKSLCVNQNNVLPYFKLQH